MISGDILKVQIETEFHYSGIKSVSDLISFIHKLPANHPYLYSVL